MNKLIVNGFIFIICWPSYLFAEPHTNLQSHYCHTYQDVSECSERCINYYDREHKPLKKRCLTLINFFIVFVMTKLQTY